MSDIKRLAVIPARGGSKRIPHKNIREFLGKPLIAYSIEAAVQSHLFDKVVISTDDEEIAAVASKYGAEVPFMRDKSLADDFTGTFAVTLDAYKRIKAQGFDADVICCIYATAPLLTAKYLIDGCKFFEDERADYLYACCEFPFPIQRAQYLDEHKAPTPVTPEFMSSRSQDLPKTYQDAGQFYFHSRHNLLDRGEPMIKRGFELPRHRVIDIDTPEDWDYAQAMAKAVTELGLS